ncbi:MAG: hypothetical protein ACYDC2_09810 [Solirubrobacteraceae bacterium]
MARRRDTDSIPWPRVRNALDRGDLAWLRSNAEHLAPMRLTDALRICLIVRDREPASFERAAVRWLARFAQEAREVTLADVRRAAEALGAMPRDADSAMEELAGLCRRYKLAGC